MEKNGMLTENSLSDYDTTKKAAYYEKNGFAVADENNKYKLKDPQPVVSVDLVKPIFHSVVNNGDSVKKN
jgi:hypothetical protein